MRKGREGRGAAPTLDPAHLSRNSRSSRRPASRSAVRLTRPELRCAAMAAAHVTRRPSREGAGPRDARSASPLPCCACAPESRAMLLAHVALQPPAQLRCLRLQGSGQHPAMVSFAARSRGSWTPTSSPSSTNFRALHRWLV